MAKATKQPNLEEVFGPTEELDEMTDDAALDEGDEDAEDDEALDAAIDEAFETTDPEARREAFKNAVRLCKGY